MTTSQLFWYGLGRIVFVLVVVVLVFAPIVLVAERRQSAMIQDRLGPSRADVTIFGVKFTLGGLLHSMADALKMIFKEDFVPPNADKFLHSIAPIIALIPTLATFAVIPFGDVMYLDHLGEFLPREGVPGAITMPLQIASVNVGILFSFAIAGTGIIGAAIGGYASDNKFSLLGGLRAASQMVSYEVALGLTLVPCFMMYSSLRLEDMARFQAEHAWGIFYPPLTVAAILYFTAAIAETKRVPFDAPEGESEIVAGYFTEYSGFKFGMFYMGEFIEVVALACFAAVMFFGGWDVPFLYRDGWDLPGTWTLTMPAFHVGSHGWDAFTLLSDTIRMRHFGVLVIQVLVFFFVKVAALVWFQLMIRWSLPRFRYDQIMALCWKGLLPVALANTLVTAIWILYLEPHVRHLFG
ncbi:MAG: complex I subunit 1 family protein [Polyangiales bacterium]